MTFKITAAVFPGGFNLPLWTAIEEGFFAKRGLEVDLYYVNGSIEQLPGLINGDWQLGLTGIDNIVAYQSGQGEAEIAGDPDLFAFMGGDDAFLRLVVQSDIATYDDLKGKTLAVDAMTTGFAFVLRKMVERSGLGPNEVGYEKAGGVLQRWDALKEGKFAGTLLLTPFEIIGEQLGLRLLQKASEVFDSYQGIVGATRRSWAQANGAQLTDFISAYLDALDWLFDPANRKAAITRLTAHVTTMPDELAARACEIFFAETGGFERHAKLDIEGIKTVAELRGEYGTPPRNLVEATDYIDTSWYDAAIAGRAR